MEIYLFAYKANYSLEFEDKNKEEFYSHRFSENKARISFFIHESLNHH